MKAVILTILGLLFCSSVKAQTPVDYQLHMAVAYGITTTAYDIARYKGLDKGDALLWATGAGLAAGLIKELAIDTYADPKDMQANMFGTVLGLVVPIYFDEF